MGDMDRLACCSLTSLVSSRYRSCELRYQRFLLLFQCTCACQTLRLYERYEFPDAFMTPDCPMLTAASYPAPPLRP